jgi:DNA-binding MarR family transcriptional regulator
MTDSNNGTIQPIRQTYIHFLMALYREGEPARKLVSMTPFDQRLLEIVTARHALDRPLSMMQILNAQDVLFLGPSSISRKIDSLIARGFVRVTADAADRRIKFVEPTDKTLAYFDDFNVLMPA